MIVDAHTHLMVGGSGDQQVGSLASFVGSLQDLGIDLAKAAKQAQQKNPAKKPQKKPIEDLLR